MSGFTPLESTAGGLLIGAAASLLFWGNGRIAGISGITADAASSTGAERIWRLLFVAGLLAGGGLLFVLRPSSFEAVSGVPVLGLAIAGLAVGAGTRISGGCTSGHGVCGIARLSRRSIVATAVFMLTAAVTVFVVRHLVGAWS